jgi:hypothetical protein
LKYLERYLVTIKQAGLTLNNRKATLAKHAVKFVGYIVGNHYRLADPEKVAAIHKMRVPQLKKEVRQILGLFSYFRDYVPAFADIARLLADLMSRRITSHIPSG